ncbi:hypothetical protein [Pseudorhodoplanes sp.]|uniref:hypothetical protein n=1 Tax=Pseudorhodoplanes sp. TaxID=1934341 RepID=UPI00391ADCDD
MSETPYGLAPHSDTIPFLRWCRIRSAKVFPRNLAADIEMFAFFRRAKLAKQVAYSIGQLIDMLSIGSETTGPQTPERLLRKLASQFREEENGHTRILLALVPIVDQEQLPLSLMMEPDEKQVLMI